MRTGDGTEAYTSSVYHPPSLSSIFLRGPIQKEQALFHPTLSLAIDAALVRYEDARTLGTWISARTELHRLLEQLPPNCYRATLPYHHAVQQKGTRR